MTITTQLQHVDENKTNIITGVDLIAMGAADLASLTPQTPFITRDGSSVQPYVLANGNPDNPATVTLYTGVQKRKGALTRHIAGTFASFAQTTDSITNEVAVAPFDVSLSCNLPADVQVDPEDLAIACQHLILLMLPNSDADLRGTVLAKLQFGIAAALTVG